jgi:hypothetical protein
MPPRARPVLPLKKVGSGPGGPPGIRHEVSRGPGRASDLGLRVGRVVSGRVFSRQSGQGGFRPDPTGLGGLESPGDGVLDALAGIERGRLKTAHGYAFGVVTVGSVGCSSGDRSRMRELQVLS